MTRDEAKKLVAKIFMDSDYCDCGNRQVNDYDIQDIVDEIYNDFDSQICKNCTFYHIYPHTVECAEDFTVDILGCSKRHERHPETFGCNEFKRKIK